MLLKVNAVVVLRWALFLTEAFIAAQSIPNEAITTKTQIFQNVGNTNPLTLITTEGISTLPSLPPYIFVTTTIMTPGSPVTHTVTKTMPEITKTMTVSLATVTTTGLCFASANISAQSAAIPRMGNPFHPFILGFSTIRSSIKNSIRKATGKYYELYLTLRQPDYSSIFPITKRNDKNSVASTMTILSKEPTALLLYGSLVPPATFVVLIIYYFLKA
ncbi:hypothetical protein BGZ60DRAFT_557728 [Tricladium varicosporioides]|nr:hypothetical protein BGZ60DRAFT_557728 [Hymenoscyphus varicosporioides]